MKSAAGGAAETSQQIIDELIKVAVSAEVHVHPRAGATAHPSGLIPVLAKLFVTAAFIGIGQDLVGLAHLLETRFRSRITGIHIRVVLPRQLAECAFDRIGVGTAVNTQHLEVILESAAGHGV